MNLNLFRVYLHSHPDEAYRRVLELRSQFTPMLFDEAPLRENPLRHARQVTRYILWELERSGLSMNNVDPGHGPGHWVRDYLNALRIFSKSELSSPHIIAGFIGGVLHDVGCTIVPRYDEKNTPLRHGEVMGLLFEDMCRSIQFIDLTPPEMQLVMWGIMAHTHYLAPQKVMWWEKEVVIEPYPDCDETGNPLFGIWLPRWVDRLECSGSETFPARHWLTLGDPHIDFGTDGFYDVEFAKHTRPILRSNEEIKADGGQRTMLEHLRMFADSQTNASPYGKFDQGLMIELRDAKRERLREFIAAVAGSMHPNILEEDVRWISKMWTMFLTVVIEPSQAGKQAAMKLEKLFGELSYPVRVAWCHGFLVAMRDYLKWGPEMKHFLDEHSFNEFAKLPFVSDPDTLLTPLFLHLSEARIYSLLS